MCVCLYVVFFSSSNGLRLKRCICMFRDVFLSTVSGVVTSTAFRSIEGAVICTLSWPGTVFHSLG